jgi:imidazolonepropionase-like amidohydrolase
VLDAATVVAAEALGLDGRTGRLAEGLSADLLVVDGDPRANLDVLRRPALVLAAGRPHKPEPVR